MDPEGSQTISGSGEFVSYGATLKPRPFQTLTNGADPTIRGEGSLDAGDGVVVNQGSIVAEFGRLHLHSTAVGAIEGADGSTFDGVSNDGWLRVRGGEITRLANATNQQAGRIIGGGSILLDGTLVNEGILSPGEDGLGSLSVLGFTGAIDNADTSVLEAEISLTGSDRLAVDGTYEIDGRLSVSALGA